MEDFCILLLAGHRVDRQKLRQVKLKSGDILHVFLPTAGG
jgi:hypothetical protein